MARRFTHPMVRTLYHITDVIETHRMRFQRWFIPAINRRLAPLCACRRRRPALRRWLGALPVRPPRYRHILDD